MPSGETAATGFFNRPASVEQLCYSLGMTEVVFSDEALRLFSKLSKRVRAFVKKEIRRHLAEADPRQASRNKFRLRRVSQFAEYELRLGRWRVFYRLRDERVEIVLIGEKRGNTLLIGGEEFKL